jgi:beta-xylosidase
MIIGSSKQPPPREEPAVLNLPVRLIGATLACAAAATQLGAADKPAFVPVLRQDFPDPHIVEHEGAFTAYATNPPGGQINVQMASSSDLVAWQSVRDPARPKALLDALPELGAWAKEGWTWAPEVIAVGGKWVLYYTARDRKSELQCLGVATASSPRGPFVDTRAEPLVCQRALGGTIDANAFQDADGKLYLYYKNDGNNPKARKPTDIWAQRLSADGTALDGDPVALLRNDKPWEAHVVEAPSMVRTPTGYTMLFSANHFGWESNQKLSPYAMGYALCRGPMGPCTDAPDNPILYSYSDSKAGCLSGPGHQTVFTGKGRSYIAFHAWSASAGCRKLDNRRYMYIAPLGWKDGKPLIAPSLRAEK